MKFLLVNCFFDFSREIDNHKIKNLLITIQKITPLALLSYYMTEQKTLISIAIIISAVVGALGGLNQTLLRKLLAYSSINHIAWIISALIISERIWLIYFTLYSLISLSVVSMLHFTQTFHFNHLINKIAAKPAFKISLFISLLSLGGLPPFTGFVPKWLVIQQLCITKNFLLVLILLVSSLFTLFYYLRITLGSLMLSSIKIKWTIKINIELKIIFIATIVNFIGLLTPSLIYSLLI